MEHAEWKRGLLIAVSRPKEQAKGICRLTHAGMAAGAEDIGWLDTGQPRRRASGRDTGFAGKKHCQRDGFACEYGVWLSGGMEKPSGT